MSDNSWQKGYSEYFASLEKQLDKSKNADNNATPSLQKKVVTIHKKRKKGIYKVLRIRKSVLAVALALVLIITLASVLGGSKKANADEQGTTSTEQLDTHEIVENVPKLAYSATESTVAIPASNDAKSAIIVDKSTNTIVAERNIHTKTYPASTTKIMTLLVAVENIKDLNDTFTMSLDITDPLYIADASVAGFLNGEKVSMKDMLYGTILPSGADAAMGLAIKISGSEEEFVKLMNKKVKELGLNNTNFTNVTGLHNVNNYSSAYDMAIILDAALQNDICKEVLSTYQYTTAKSPQNPEGIPLSSTLFSYMYGTEPETATILGGKTGFVNESGYCIASYGEANESGNEYIVITLGNSARWPAFYGQIDLYKEFAK